MFIKRLILAIFFTLLSLLIYAPPVGAIDGEQIYTGTSLTFSNVDDAFNGPVNIGFTFNYFGTDYTQAFVSTNGIVSFGSGTSSYSNSATGINNAIHAFWDDLIIQTGVSSVYTATIGEEGSRKFITQWTSMYFYGTSITMGTFQAILYEGSNEVRIQYRDLLGGTRSNGDSATIGIKGPSTFLMYSNNTASIVQEQSILYTPDGGGSYTVNSSSSYDAVYLQSSNAPDSPVLVNPQNAITGTTVTPTFEWLTANQATSYQLLISTVSNFSTTVVNQSGIVGTSYTLGSPLNYNTTYYWRVVGVNAYGTNMSGSRTFQTAGEPNSNPSITGAITASDWSNGDLIGLDTLESGGYSITIADSDTGEQVRYRIQIAQDSDFTDLIIDYRSAFNSAGEFQYSIGESGGTYLIGSADHIWVDLPYYVRARAEDDGSASSSWVLIDGVAFELDSVAPNTPDKPVQIGESNANGSATVGWSTSLDSDLLDSPYTVEYSASVSFDAFSSISTSLLQYSFTSLLNSTNYYFRLVVVDSVGNRSEYSDVLTVYIPPAIIPPVLRPIEEEEEEEPLNPIVKIIKPPVIYKPVSSPVTNPDPLPSEDSKVILDAIDEYKSGDGAVLELKKDKLVYFNVKEVEHSAKVEEVGEDYVVIEVSAGEGLLRLSLGEKIIYDVDKDGVDDIEMEFVEVKDGEPILRFKPAVAGVSAVDLPQNPSVEKVENKEKGSFNWIPYLIGGVTIYIYLKYRDKRGKH